MRIIIALVLITLCSQLSYGQEEKVTYHNQQFWTSLNVTARMTERWGAITDVHIRRNDFLKTSDFYFLRLGAAYWASNEFTLAGGYAHLWKSQTVDGARVGYSDENRIYQQVLWRKREGKVTFLSRLRNEQRWQEVLNTNGQVDRVRFSNRVRFLMSVSWKAFNNPKWPALVLSDEILFHFGKEIIYNAMDQNRTFVGINQRLTKDLSFDLGYMLVYQQRYSGFEYDMNHTFRLFFYYTPDWRKEKVGPHYSIPGDE